MHPFAALAGDPDASLGDLALALAAEFRDVEAADALERLEALSGEVARLAAGSDGLDALTEVLGRRHGFGGAQREYDHPDNSMLDLVLQRAGGLPIALSVVYLETARRAGIALAGVGLPGHFVVGRFQDGAAPVLLDPFAGGAVLAPRAVAAAGAQARQWGPHETALRMLNNLVGSYERRNDLGRAIRAAEMRLELPLAAPLERAMRADVQRVRARLN